MKSKGFALILSFITAFSFTACQKNSHPKEKIDYNIVDEKVVKEENHKNGLPSNIKLSMQPSFENIEPAILKPGTNGKIVEILQDKLNNFGYNLILDGHFGQQTLNAVLDFQRRNNISLSETVNNITMEKLHLTPTKETMYNPKDDIYKPELKGNESEKFVNSKDANSPTQYYIWVNTSIPKVYIFQGYNRNWKLIKDLPCTVGAPSTPTIKGSFNIGIKGASFVVKDNPNLQCNYYTQISGNYLFHTVLLYRNGKIADGRLGLKLSHGCIRLAIPDAKYIYDSIPTGTTVYIT